MSPLLTNGMISHNSVYLKKKEDKNISIAKTYTIELTFSDLDKF